jgi:hypothetical protein
LRRFVTLPGLNLFDRNNKNPIVIGLLNGLMPCGPLQAMLIYAAGTGSALEGALVMAAFGLGTIPLMLALGSITSIAASSRIWIHKIVKFSGVLVIVLGIIMLNRGFALTGIDPFGVFSFAISPKSTSNLSQVFPILNDSGAGKLGDNSTNPKYQEITMYIISSGWNPDTFTVKKGILVKWTIIAKELTYCNKGIKAPKLGMSHTFDNVGDTFTFEFTPTEVGTIPFTCWMGMISGKIEVIE